MDLKRYQIRSILVPYITYFENDVIGDIKFVFVT